MIENKDEWREKAAFWLALTRANGSPRLFDLPQEWRTHERRRRGRRMAVVLWRRLRRKKTVPKGKVVVHGFPDGGTNVWVQSLTDDIEPCDCGSRLFSPMHYREKEGIKREIDAVLSAPPIRRMIAK
jgi:hypothetical protein